MPAWPSSCLSSLDAGLNYTFERVTIDTPDHSRVISRFSFSHVDGYSMSTADGIRVERPTAESAVVVLTGEHDLSNNLELEQVLDSLIADTTLVVADVSEAEFVDSTILNTLVRMHKQAAGLGCTFRVQLGTKAIVYRAFELTGVLHVLDCAPTRDEALRPRPSEGSVGRGLRSAG